MKTPRPRLLQLALRTLALSGATGAATAQNAISLNFTDSAAGSTVVSGTAGALPIAAGFWNNLNSVNGDGTFTGLKDSTGATTSANITWSSANTWRGGGTTVNGNGQLTKGYLDDGGGGNLVTVANIPYLSYNAYVILAGDLGGGVQNAQPYSAISINGVGYSHNDIATVQSSVSWTGQSGTDAATLVEGQNYLKIPHLGGLTLTVRGTNVAGSRGSIAGLQIQDSYAGAMAYWDLNGATAGAGGGAPAGSWSTGGSNWNAAADGTGATGLWAGAGHTAVFAAGTDATGSYTVSVSGSQTADAIIVKRGNVTLAGGTLNLATPAVVRADAGSGIALNSTLSGASGLVLEGGGHIEISGTHPITGPAVFSVPTLTFGSGTNFQALGGFAVADNVALAADHASVTSTDSMSMTNGSRITASASTFAINGDVSITGGSIAASGATTFTARNFVMRTATATPDLALADTSSIQVSADAPTRATFELDGGSVTLGGAAKIGTDRWVNRGTGLSHTLAVADSAQLNVSGDLIFGDNSNAPITITQTGGAVTNLGAANNPAAGDLANRWGHWAGGTTLYNISAGSLNLTGAPLYLSWDGDATLDVSGSAEVNLKGIQMGYGARTALSTIQLAGGRLNLGSDGIASGTQTNKTIHLGAGILGATANWASDLPMDIAAATTVDTGAFDIALAGNLTGTGGLTKTGGGTLVLAGINSYAGATNVNAGMLRIGGDIDGVVNIAAGASVGAGAALLPGSGSVSKLSLQNGSSSVFRLGPVVDQLQVLDANGLSAAGTHSIQLVGGVGMGPGTYPLFDYSGAIGGAGFSAFTLGSKPHLTASLANNTAGSSVDLVIAGIDTLVWTGLNGGTWDLTNPQNWKLDSDGSAVPYFQTDLVRFSDGATTGNVTLSGPVTPGQLVFDNSTLPYTLSGTAIGGETGLTKTGTAKVTLLNANTYHGATAVNAGTLQVGDGVTGSLSPLSPLSIAPDAEFILHPAAEGEFANLVINEGTFRIVGAANVALNGVWDFPNPGAIVIDSTAAISFPTTKANWSGDLTANAGTVKAGGPNLNTLGEGSDLRTLTFNGASTVLSLEASNVFGPGSTEFIGIPVIVLNGATLTANAYNVIGDVTLNGGKISGASVDPSAGYRGFEMRGTITVTGTAPSLIETTTAHENHLDAATTFQVEDVTASPATDLRVTAPFRDGSPDHESIAGGMIKLGAGTLELAAANTYTGWTDVQEGTLKIDGSLAETLVTIASGATLGGAGSIGGQVMLDAGSFLAPGTPASATGLLSVTNDLALGGSFQVEIDGGNADCVEVQGELDITTATLELAVLGGGAGQGSYVIAQYGTLTGSAFAAVNGLPAGYTLDYHFGPDGNQIALVNPSANPYQTWATRPPYNLTGANAAAGADPDGDGIPNAIEFVIGGNPAGANDRAKLPTSAVVAGNLEFTFRRTSLSNYAPAPAVEYGSDLSGWTRAQEGANGVAIVVTGDFYGAGIDRVVVKIPQALAGGAKLFARLIATP